MTDMVKKGFTIIEMMIVIGIIGVLVSVVAFQFHGAQLRTRTAENSKRAHDIINSAEQQLALATYDRSYPDKRNVQQWQYFQNTLPSGSLDNLVTDMALLPSAEHPQRLLYLNCRDSNDQILGLIVQYWDYVEAKVKSITTGEVEASAGVSRCD